MDFGNLQIWVNWGVNLEQGVFLAQYFEEGSKISDNSLAHLCALLDDLLFCGYKDGTLILEEQTMVFMFVTMLMHQAGKKIKKRGDFLFFQPGDKGLQEGGIGEALQECFYGLLIGFPVEAKADFCRFSEGWGCIFAGHGGLK
jgi:hypothetical protein